MHVASVNTVNYYSIVIIIIIIIRVFSLIALQNQNKVDQKRVKKARSFKYGYRKS